LKLRHKFDNYCDTSQFQKVSSAFCWAPAPFELNTIYSEDLMNDNSEVLARVLAEVKAAETLDSLTTSHNSYVSGVFEQEPVDDSVLARVLAEVKAAEKVDSLTTSHNSYVSGVFESET
jgi:hypothetical protein